MIVLKSCLIQINSRRGFYIIMISKIISFLTLTALSTCQFVDRGPIDIPYYPKLAEIPELEADKFNSANVQKDLVILSDESKHAHSIKDDLHKDDMFISN